MLSTSNDKTEIIKKILNDYDFDHTLKNNEGYNAIMIALKNSNFKIVDLFINKLLTKMKNPDVIKIIEEAKKNILFNDYDENHPKTIPKDFIEYIEYIDTGNLNVNIEPCHIDNLNCEVYIIGDLEGDYNVLYNWLLSKKFIDENLQWIALDNVYIIQCGDQLDNGKSSRYNNKFFPRLAFFNRKNIKFADYYTYDIYLMLFMDYLSIKSNNHVLSILGNHEIMNIQKQFMYVNLSKLKPSDLKLNDYAKKDIPNFDNVVKYLNDRKDLFLANGKFAKIIRRRNFIILFNDLIISHAGVLKTFIDKTNNNFNILVRSEFVEYIKNINNQIRLKKIGYQA